MMKEGFTNVAALLGGWAAWTQNGYPIQGKAVPTPTATVAGLAAGGATTVLGNDGAPITIMEFSDYQ